jgi:hypothetical protein
VLSWLKNNKKSNSKDIDKQKDKEEGKDKEKDKDKDRVRIIYTSRTHSQLGEVEKEL